MYRIVICDDEIFFCTHIRKFIEKYVEAFSIDVEIKSYTRSDDFIKNIKNETDLYFLDIKMPDNSGLELANAIRNISSDAKIIFVSSLSDVVYESIQYSPFRFIRKEYLDAELLLPEQYRSISVEIIQTENQLSILIMNKIATSILSQNPTPHSTKSEEGVHGIGLKNVQKIVNSLDGLIDIFEENGCFCVHMFFN